MIYDVHGTQLNDAYSKTGESLEKAYDVNKNIVFQKSYDYDYTQYTISSAGVGNQGQGIDAYGNTLAVWHPSDRVDLFNLATKKRYAYFPLGTTDHGNDISFSQEFYSPSDTLPLLYISGTGYRLYKEDGVWTGTRIKSLITPNVYGRRMGMAFDGNVLYTAGYLGTEYTYSAGNDVIIAKWDLTDLTDNGDGSYTVGLISTAHHAWFKCIQGVTYHDGYVWCVCGLGGTIPVIYALDPDTAEIAYTIEPTNTGEPEGLTWAYNDTDGWYMLFFHKTGGNMRKVTFAH